MNALKKLLALLLLATISSTASAITDAQLFAYAEASYSSLFHGTATAGQFQQYDYRYYPATQNYLAVDTSGTVYVLGPVSGGAIAPVGTLTAFAKAVNDWQATQPAPVASAAWQPNALDSFHLQLKGALVTNIAASIYDIDLFDNTAAQIAQLKQQGRKIVCYFSAGSSENWRTDFASFLAADMGNPLSGWPGENWLDTRSNNVRSIMLGRMDLALSKGCDGIDPDNVNGYTNPTGFPLTAQDQLDFNRFLSSQAHSRGLAIGLKNDVAQLSELASSFEFAVNEQCHQYSECAGYQAFTSIAKPVLNVEYQSRYVLNTGGAFDALCASALTERLRTLVLPLLLDGSFRLSCN